MYIMMTWHMYFKGRFLFYLLLIFCFFNKLSEGCKKKAFFEKYLVTLDSKKNDLAMCNACNMEESITNLNLFYDSTSRDYYFDSYAHFEVHEDMLKDRVRTITYREAILRNKHLFKDKVVLDVGCGTGILSLFAAQAGAAKVIGIDCANIVDLAKKIVRANNFDHIVTIIKGKVEEIKELPDGIQQVDVIVSEWMGYCLLFESMLQTILYARDKWLKKGGALFPDKAVLYISAIEDEAFKFDRINWWDNVHGFNMNIFKKLALMEPVIEAVEQKTVVTTDAVLKVFDLYTIKEEDVSVGSNFSLTVTRDDYIHALFTYFIVEFTRSHKPMGFSTSPKQHTTHWKQTRFFLKNVITARTGEILKGHFSLTPNRKIERDLNINIKVDYEGQISEMHEINHYRLR